MPCLGYAVGIGLSLHQFEEEKMYTILCISGSIPVGDYASYGFFYTEKPGFAFQIIACIIEAFRLSWIQILRQQSALARLSPITATYYISSATAVCLIPMCLIFEFSGLHLSDIFRVGVQALLWNVVCACVLNITMYLVLGEVTALSMNLVGAVQGSFLVCFASLALGIYMSPYQCTGHAIAFLALTFYFFRFGKSHGKHLASL